MSQQAIDVPEEAEQTWPAYLPRKELPLSGSRRLIVKRERGRFRVAVFRASVERAWRSELTWGWHQAESPSLSTAVECAFGLDRPDQTTRQVCAYLVDVAYADALSAMPR